MRAPVYRFIDAQNKLLGLSYPGEALLFVSGLTVALIALPIYWAAPLSLALYAGIRLIGRGRPPSFLPHWLQWQARKVLSGGRLSASARAAAPQFPFAPANPRDLPPRGPRG